MGALIAIAAFSWMYFGSVANEESSQAGKFFRQTGIYIVSAIIGISSSAMLITSLAITNDLIGHNTVSLCSTFEHLFPLPSFSCVVYFFLSLLVSLLLSFAFPHSLGLLGAFVLSLHSPCFPYDRLQSKLHPAYTSIKAGNYEWRRGSENERCACTCEGTCKRFVSGCKNNNNHHDLCHILLYFFSCRLFNSGGS